MATLFVPKQPVSVQRPLSLRQRLEQLAVSGATGSALLVVLVSALHLLTPQRSGILALTQIFAPYLFLALVPLIPLICCKHTRLLRIALGMGGVVFGLRFGPSLVSWPPAVTPNTPQLSAISWNTYVDNRNTVVLTHTLADSGAGVVALQEFTYAHSGAIKANAELNRLYPWQIHIPGRADGMGLLSRYPILEQGRLDNPNLPDENPILWARLDIGAGRTLLAINAHPRPGRIGFLGDLPVPHDFEPSTRDAEIRFIHEFVTARLAEGESLLLMGDFNLTEREPAYRELVAGLQDAHAAAGVGTGHSWRPSRIMQSGFALIRIDYLLSSPQLRPLATTTDCTPRGGDHCIVRGVFELQ